MKKKLFLVAILAILTGFCSYAQAPYTHSFGFTAGNMQAFSYKTVVTDHFAIQLDLGTKITIGVGKKGYTHDPWTLELNPNFLYQGNIGKGLYGFVGGGVSLGYNFGFLYYNRNLDRYYNYMYPDYAHSTDHAGFGKFGINAMMGFEYKFDAPIAISLDFRPGYGMQFDGKKYLWHYFDWGINFGLRFTM